MSFDKYWKHEKHDGLEARNTFFREQMKKAYEMGVGDAQNVLLEISIEDDSQERFCIAAEKAICSLV